MREILGAIAFAFGLCTSALATDYVQGQCPAPNSICWFGSAAFVGDFNDTSTFSVGDSPSYLYDSTSDVKVYGGRFCLPTSGHPVPPTCGIGSIDSAFLDGVPMSPPLSGYTWVIPISLTPGKHTVAVTGHITPESYPGKWNWVGRVDGVTYTFMPMAIPACTDCGSD